MGTRISNTIGFDDGPFDRYRDQRVAMVGAVFAGTRFDGMVRGEVQRDGDDATECIARLLVESAFHEHVQLVMLGGITFAGFNVVDIQALANAVARPVLVVARRRPDLPRIERALHEHFSDGETRWRRIAAAGEMEPCDEVWIQRAGIEAAAAREVLAHTTVHGKLPEPVRVAHLIAGGVTTGHSKGGA